METGEETTKNRIVLIKEKKKQIVLIVVCLLGLMILGVLLAIVLGLYRFS